MLLDNERCSTLLFALGRLFSLDQIHSSHLAIKMAQRSSPIVRPSKWSFVAKMFPEAPAIDFSGKSSCRKGDLYRGPTELNLPALPSDEMVRSEDLPVSAQYADRSNHNDFTSRKISLALLLLVPVSLFLRLLQRFNCRQHRLGFGNHNRNTLRRKNCRVAFLPIHGARAGQQQERSARPPDRTGATLPIDLSNPGD